MMSTLKVQTKNLVTPQEKLDDLLDYFVLPKWAYNNDEWNYFQIQKVALTKKILKES